MITKPITNPNRSRHIHTYPCYLPARALKAPRPANGQNNKGWRVSPKCEIRGAFLGLPTPSKRGLVFNFFWLVRLLNLYFSVFTKRQRFAKIITFAKGYSYLHLHLFLIYVVDFITKSLLFLYEVFTKSLRNRYCFVTKCIK